jgi:hypothetical protein
MVIERLGLSFLRYLRKVCFFSARCLRAAWRFNFLNFSSELMFFCFSPSDLLFVPVSLMGFSYFFFAFALAFATAFIALKEVIFLVNWSDIARPFCVLKELNFSHFEGRVIPDLRFFF